ncbi:hypothetical protein SAMN05216344_101282 [Polaromonas sp. OV174]|uniref:hypothetical protein n=1 Tax=Polaromonas sp. OV174 TaxID=1855300 RepID=UPI0008ED923D|nr:hypothetical protein [Polaromonas sp. OV174]SFB69401.1 hypothetical protein SAMN05216344_101282 [Polaromonas sp. OV174]
MMETSSIILLVVSSAISFGLGRIFVHFRDKKRARKAQERAAQALRERPVEAESRNKSKRKRQLQQLEKDGVGQKQKR